MNYDNDIKLSQEKGVIAKSDIFDYRETPLEHLFDNYYKFCREHLDNSLERYNLNPSIILFTNSLVPNAKAQFSNDTFSIHINLGLFKKCADSYLNNKSLDEYLNNKYSDLLSDFDNPLTALAFQVSTQFTYYHEFAHLIQFSKVREQLDLQERYDKEVPYDIEKQSLEINADSLASIAIATHIQQYIIKSFGENISQEKVELTIILICSCLLNYVATFCEDVSEMYFEKYSHPHPFLRLFAINLNILNYLNQSTFFAENGIEIKMNELFKRTLDFYEDLEQEKVFDTKIKNALTVGAQNRNEIVAHLGNLIEFKNDKFNDAIEEWNKHST
ncbi:hypothetical protein [Cellulophaga baltica]|uniref:hypothetical protein n=1 Tax=Cellulophaga baltica TaxID=76594 RepID=UPI0003FF2FAB|nr:hypothetical protein [Cellulophaga baltica]AIY14121.1 hypothetical protein M667_13485 [Cellulophaga baltica NN016038]